MMDGVDSSLRSREEDSVPPDLSWVPLKDELATKPKPNYKERLNKWRKLERRRLVVVVSLYGSLFLLAFVVSILVFASMGMGPENFRSITKYLGQHFGGALQAKEPQLPALFENRKYLYVLLVGLDKDPPHRSDSVLIAHIDLETLETRILSIPRDLRPTIKNKRERSVKDKLAHAYVYGGVDNVKFAVESLLGIRIEKYIVVKISGMIKIIDELGGVEIDVEKRMYYRDRAQDLTINLKAGKQRLSGDDAVSYGRFRKDIEGDNGRMRRQQVLLKAMLEEMKAPENLVTLPTILKVAFDSVETDILWGQWLGLVDALPKFSAEKVKTMTLFTDSASFEHESGISISYQFVTDKDLKEALDFLSDLSPPPEPVEEGESQVLEAS